MSSSPNLLNSKKARESRFLRATSLILVVSFLFQEVSFAYPDLKPLEWRQKNDFSKWARQILPPIPESVATIEDAWHVGATRRVAPTVILVQDAHTNTSAQINTAKLLDILFQKTEGRGQKTELRHVFLEAGYGNESLSFLRKYSPHEKREEVAKAYLMRGELQGSEYFDLTSDHDILLWGVEDLDLYKKSLEIYRSIARKREKYEDYLARVEATIETLKSRVYNPFLLEFDQKHGKYSKEELPLTEYFEILFRKAQDLKIDLGRFPHLKRLSKLKKLESQIDFKKANEEEQNALKSLSPEDQAELRDASKDAHSPFKLSSRSKQKDKAFFTLLEEKVTRTNDGSFPELFKYFRYLKTANAIDFKAVLKEEKELENEIFRALVTSPDEESLLSASKNVRILKDILHLKLTPDEFKDYRRTKDDFDIKKITGFLNKKIMDLRGLYEKAVFLESGYDDLMQACDEFYSLTYERDKKFIENMLAKLDKGYPNDTQAAILITGGYHSPNLKYLLKEQNISYISLVPQVFSETNQKRYEKLLLGQNLGSSAVKADPVLYSHINTARICTMNPWGNIENFLEDFSFMGRSLEEVQAARLADEANTPTKPSWSNIEWYWKLEPWQRQQLLHGVPGQKGFYLNGWHAKIQAGAGVSGMAESWPKFVSGDSGATWWHAEESGKDEPGRKNDFFDHLFLHEFSSAVASWAEPFRDSLEAIWSLNEPKQNRTARLMAYLKFLSLLETIDRFDPLFESALRDFADLFAKTGANYGWRQPRGSDYQMFFAAGLAKTAEEIAGLSRTAATYLNRWRALEAATTNYHVHAIEKLIQRIEAYHEAEDQARLDQLVAAARRGYRLSKNLAAILTSLTQEELGEEALLYELSRFNKEDRHLFHELYLMHRLREKLGGTLSQDALVSLKLDAYLNDWEKENPDVFPPESFFEEVVVRAPLEDFSIRMRGAGRVEWLNDDFLGVILKNYRDRATIPLLELQLLFEKVRQEKFPVYVLNEQLFATLASHTGRASIVTTGQMRVSPFFFYETYLESLKKHNAFSEEDVRRLADNLHVIASELDRHEASREEKEARITQFMREALSGAPAGARLALRRARSARLLRAGGEGPVTSPEQAVQLSLTARRGARLAEEEAPQTRLSFWTKTRLFFRFSIGSGAYSYEIFLTNFKTVPRLFLILMPVFGIFLGGILTGILNFFFPGHPWLMAAIGYATPALSLSGFLFGAAPVYWELYQLYFDRRFKDLIGYLTKAETYLKSDEKLFGDFATAGSTDSSAHLQIAVRWLWKKRKTAEARFYLSLVRGDVKKAGKVRGAAAFAAKVLRQGSPKYARGAREIFEKRLRAADPESLNERSLFTYYVYRRDTARAVSIPHFKEYLIENLDRSVSGRYFKGLVKLALSTRDPRLLARFLNHRHVLRKYRFTNRLAFFLAHFDADPVVDEALLKYLKRLNEGGASLGLEREELFVRLAKKDVSRAWIAYFLSFIDGLSALSNSWLSKKTRGLARAFLARCFPAAAPEEMNYCLRNYPEHTRRAMVEVVLKLRASMGRRTPFFVVVKNLSGAARRLETAGLALAQIDTDLLTTVFKNYRRKSGAALRDLAGLFIGVHQGKYPSYVLNSDLLRVVAANTGDESIFKGSRRLESPFGDLMRYAASRSKTGKLTEQDILSLADLIQIVAVQLDLKGMPLAEKRRHIADLLRVEIFKEPAGARLAARLAGDEGAPNEGAPMVEASLKDLKFNALIRVVEDSASSASLRERAAIRLVPYISREKVRRAVAAYFKEQTEGRYLWISNQLLKALFGSSLASIELIGRPLSELFRLLYAILTDGPLSEVEVAEAARIFRSDDPFMAAKLFVAVRESEIKGRLDPAAQLRAMQDLIKYVNVVNSQLASHVLPPEKQAILLDPDFIKIIYQKNGNSFDSLNYLKSFVRDIHTIGVDFKYFDPELLKLVESKSDPVFSGADKAAFYRDLVQTIQKFNKIGHRDSLLIEPRFLSAIIRRRSLQGGRRILAILSDLVPYGIKMQPNEEIGGVTFIERIESLTGAHFFSCLYSLVDYAKQHRGALTDHAIEEMFENILAVRNAVTDDLRRKGIYSEGHVDRIIAEFIEENYGPAGARLALRRARSARLLRAGGEGPVTSPESLVAFSEKDVIEEVMAHYRQNPSEIDHKLFVVGDANRAGAYATLLAISLIPYIGFGHVREGLEKFIRDHGTANASQGLTDFIINPKRFLRPSSWGLRQNESDILEKTLQKWSSAQYLAVSLWVLGVLLEGRYYTSSGSFGFRSEDILMELVVPRLTTMSAEEIAAVLERVGEGHLLKPVVEFFGALARNGMLADRTFNEFIREYFFPRFFITLISVVSELKGNGEFRLAAPDFLARFIGRAEKDAEALLKILPTLGKRYDGFSLFLDAVFQLTGIYGADVVLTLIRNPLNRQALDGLLEGGTAVHNTLRSSGHSEEEARQKTAQFIEEHYGANGARLALRLGGHEAASLRASPFDKLRASPFDKLRAGGEGPVTSPEQAVQLSLTARRGARLAHSIDSAPADKYEYRLSESQIEDFIKEFGDPRIGNWQSRTDKAILLLPYMNREKRVKEALAVYLRDAVFGKRQFFRALMGPEAVDPLNGVGLRQLNFQAFEDALNDVLSRHPEIDAEALRQTLTSSPVREREKLALWAYKSVHDVAVERFESFGLQDGGGDEYYLRHLIAANLPTLFGPCPKWLVAVLKKGSYTAPFPEFFEFLYRLATGEPMTEEQVREGLRIYLELSPTKSVVAKMFVALRESGLKSWETPRSQFQSLENLMAYARVWKEDESSSKFGLPAEKREALLSLDLMKAVYEKYDGAGNPLDPLTDFIWSRVRPRKIDVRYVHLKLLETIERNPQKEELYRVIGSDVVPAADHIGHGDSAFVQPDYLARIIARTQEDPIPALLALPHLHRYEGKRALNKKIRGTRFVDRISVWTGPYFAKTLAALARYADRRGNALDDQAVAGMFENILAVRSTLRSKGYAKEDVRQKTAQFIEEHYGANGARLAALSRWEKIKLFFWASYEKKFSYFIPFIMMPINGVTFTIGFIAYFFGKTEIFSWWSHMSFVFAGVSSIMCLFPFAAQLYEFNEKIKTRLFYYVWKRLNLAGNERRLAADFALWRSLTFGKWNPRSLGALWLLKKTATPQARFYVALIEGRYEDAAKIPGAAHFAVQILRGKDRESLPGAFATLEKIVSEGTSLLDDETLFTYYLLKGKFKRAAAIPGFVRFVPEAFKGRHLFYLTQLRKFILATDEPELLVRLLKYFESVESFIEDYDGVRATVSKLLVHAGTSAADKALLDYFNYAVSVSRSENKNFERRKLSEELLERPAIDPAWFAYILPWVNHWLPQGAPQDWRYLRDRKRLNEVLTEHFFDATPREMDYWLRNYSEEIRAAIIRIVLELRPSLGKQTPFLSIILNVADLARYPERIDPELLLVIFRNYGVFSQEVIRDLISLLESVYRRELPDYVLNPQLLLLVAKNTSEQSFGGTMISPYSYYRDYARRRLDQKKLTEQDILRLAETLHVLAVQFDAHGAGREEKHRWIGQFFREDLLREEGARLALRLGRFAPSLRASPFDKLRASPFDKLRASPFDKLRAGGEGPVTSPEQAVQFSLTARRGARLARREGSEEIAEYQADRFRKNEAMRRAIATVMNPLASLQDSTRAAVRLIPYFWDKRVQAALAAYFEMLSDVPEEFFAILAGDHPLSFIRLEEAIRKIFGDERSAEDEELLKILSKRPLKERILETLWVSKYPERGSAVNFISTELPNLRADEIRAIFESLDEKHPFFALVRLLERLASHSELTQKDILDLPITNLSHADRTVAAGLFIGWYELVSNGADLSCSHMYNVLQDLNAYVAAVQASPRGESLVLLPPEKKAMLFDPQLIKTVYEGRLALASPIRPMREFIKKAREIGVEYLDRRLLMAIERSSRDIFSAERRKLYDALAAVLVEMPEKDSFFFARPENLAVLIERYKEKSHEILPLLPKLARYARKSDFLESVSAFTGPHAVESFVALAHYAARHGKTFTESEVAGIFENILVVKNTLKDKNYSEEDIQRNLARFIEEHYGASGARLALRLGGHEAASLRAGGEGPVTSPEQAVQLSLTARRGARLAQSDSLLKAQQFLAKLGIEVTLDDLLLNFLPDNVRRNLPTRDFGELKKLVKKENFTEETYAAYLYLNLKKEAGSAAVGLFFKTFYDVLKGIAPDSPYAELIEHYVSEYFTGKRLSLTRGEQDAVIGLSIMLNRKIMDLLRRYPVDGDHVVTFRELVRFNVDFSRYYLHQEGFRNVLEQFILTAYNIYGRAVATEAARREFVQILSDAFHSKEYRSLFGKAILDSVSLKGDIVERIGEIIAHADYEHLERAPSDGQVPLEVSLEATVARAEQVSRPLLLVVNSDNSVVVEDVLERLDRRDGRTVRISASDFSRRRELFGMYMPKPEQNGEAGEHDLMEWHDGVLVKMAQAAEADRDHAFRIIIDNVETLPSRVRVQLNPVLWEKRAEIPDRGKTVVLPPNLHFIFTMHEDNAIKDDSFMNRPLVQCVKVPVTEDASIASLARYLAAKTGLSKAQALPLARNYALLRRLKFENDPEVTIEDFIAAAQKLDVYVNTHFKGADREKARFLCDPAAPRPQPDLDALEITGYLSQRVGVTEETERFLWDLYFSLKRKKFIEDPGFNFMDLVQIARRVKFLSAEHRLEERKLVRKEAYDYLWLRLRAEGDRRHLEKLKESGVAKPTLRIKGDSILFDGVVLKMSPDFARYAAENPGKSAAGLILGFYGFVVSDLETRLFAQLARDARCGFGVAQLEGPSGEGKTEICRVFAKMTGYRLRERTINEDTDLSEFRGHIHVNRDGRYALYEPEYLSEIEAGGNAFLENEINTNQESALYYWQFPEIVRRARKYLPEFAPVGHNGELRSAAVSRDNLWLYTVNPDNFEGRSAVPPRIAAHIPRYYMATDPKYLPEIIEGFFKEKGLEKNAERFAPILTQIHLELMKAKKTLRVLTSPQDVTRREILRVVEDFQNYRAAGVDADEAFVKAVEGVYVYMWKETADKTKAREILSGIRKARGISAKGRRSVADVLRSVLKKGKPVLVFYNAANELLHVKNLVRAEDPGAVLHEAPVSYFHRKRQFLRGLIPSRESRPLKKLSPRFDLGFGFIPLEIEEARLDGAKNHYVFLHNYTRLNPQSAPLLNEFFQTGRLESLAEDIDARVAAALLEKISRRDPARWEALRTECRQATGRELPDQIARVSEDEAAAVWFARWFYTHAPRNLHFIATGSSEEKTHLSPAEIDRFISVNIAEPVSKWIKPYLSRRLSQAPAPLADHAARKALEAFELYDSQMRQYDYEHNRMGKADVDAFLAELELSGVFEGQAQNAAETIDKIAYYTFGIGLRKEYQEKLSFKPKSMDHPEARIGYRKDAHGRVCFFADGISIETEYKEIPADSGFLAPTEGLVRQLASMIITWRHNRPVVVEGFPGGGKTVSFPELAKRLGVPSYRQVMYGEIDLGAFLGRLSKRGDEFILTAEKDASGRFHLEFLRAYAGGGLYLLDEGAIGANSQETIAYLTLLSQIDEIDLGTFHPGWHGAVVKRHKNFRLGITQNPALSTTGRESIPYAADTLSHKIWSDNALSVEDAVRIIDYTLKDVKDRVSRGTKEKIAEIHRVFVEKHPHGQELSPRQLILVAESLKKAMLSGEDAYGLERAIFSGVMLAYLSRLEPADFEEMWKRVRRVFGAGFTKHLEWWKSPGIALPASGSSNVLEADIVYPEQLPSQNAALRAMAYGFSLKMPTALLESDGADAYDLVKKFAHQSGCELKTLWSHPQMSNMHLVSSVLMKFEDTFNRYGVTRQNASKEFRLALGFLLREFVPAERYETEKREPHRQKLLFFNLMDAIPERQRVVLNIILSEMLAGRRMSVQNEKGEAVEYVLPEWVNILVSSPVSHRFSSAFINRFLPVHVEAFRDPAEVRTLILNRYPLLDEREIGWILRIAERVSEYDKSGRFGLHYGFTVRDVFKLACLIQLDKQRDFKPLNPNPFYYVLKAAAVAYLEALEPADRRKFENEILKELLYNAVFDKRATAGEVNYFYRETLEPILERMSLVETEKKHVELNLAELEAVDHPQRTIGLPNGISIEKVSPTPDAPGPSAAFVVKTPAANYPMSEESLDAGRRLSDDLCVKKEGNKIIFEYEIIRSIGGVELNRDAYNEALALPAMEVATPEYIRHTDEFARTISCLLRSWRRVEDYAGTLHLPRVVLLNGETGAAKTTGIRNLSRVWGVPLYTLNAYEELKVSDATVGFKMEAGAAELGIKEFLARVGKIRKAGEAKWQRIRAPGQETSNRSILLVDEANASPELIFALMPLFRGERRFTLEYGGESFEVETDGEIMIVLTFNPMEKYSGREGFAREITSYADKLWPPNPLDYEDWVLADMLYEYHRRGIDKARKALWREHGERRPPPRVWQEGYIEVEPVTETLWATDEELHRDSIETVLERLKNIKAYEKEKAEAEEAGRTPEELGLPEIPRDEIKVEYNVAKIKEAADRFKPEAADAALLFAKDVLAPFVLAAADGESEDALVQSVYRAARSLDAEIEKAVVQFVALYNKSVVSEDKLREVMLRLRALFADRGVQLFLPMAVKHGDDGDVAYVLVFAEKISRFFLFGAEHFKKIGLDPLEYRHEKIRANIVPGEVYPSKDARGYFEGEQAVVFESTAHRNLPGVPSAETVNWTAWHELGHLIDQLRFRKRGDPLPENIELNSMLFPLIFSVHAKEYLTHELGGLLRREKDEKSYYTQAAKGILNGLLLYTRDQAGRQVDKARELITDQFEDSRVLAIAKELSALGRDELQEAAAKIYEYRNKYLYTAKKGVYRFKAILGSGGSSMEEMMAGVDGPPDVELEFVEGAGGDLKIKTPDNNKKKSQFRRSPRRKMGKITIVGKRPPLPKEPKEKGGKDQIVDKTEEKKERGGDSSTDVQSDLEALEAASPGALKKFLQAYTGLPKVVYGYAEEGDEPDMVRILEWDPEAFRTAHVVEGLASVSIGLTIDISGSTGGGLDQMFMDMVRRYTSLFFYAAVRNKGVEFSLSGLGSRFFPFLSFKNCRDKSKVERALASIRDRLATEGTDIQGAVEGIIAKYKNDSTQEKKLEIILTDGLGGVSPATLKEAHDRGIDIVFLGIETPAVKNFTKSINLDHQPTADEIMDVILRLSILKAKRGRLPEEGLEELLGLPSESGARLAEPERGTEYRDFLLRCVSRLGETDARESIRKAFDKMPLFDHGYLVEALMDLSGAATEKRLAERMSLLLYWKDVRRRSTPQSERQDNLLERVDDFLDFSFSRVEAEDLERVLEFMPADRRAHVIRIFFDLWQSLDERLRLLGMICDYVNLVMVPKNSGSLWEIKHLGFGIDLSPKEQAILLGSYFLKTALAPDGRQERKNVFDDLQFLVSRIRFQKIDRKYIHRRFLLVFRDIANNKYSDTDIYRRLFGVIKRLDPRLESNLAEPEFLAELAVSLYTNVFDVISFFEKLELYVSSENADEARQVAGMDLIAYVIKLTGRSSSGALEALASYAEHQGKDFPMGHVGEMAAAIKAVAAEIEKKTSDKEERQRLVAKFIIEDLTSGARLSEMPHDVDSFDTFVIEVNPRSDQLMAILLGPSASVLHFKRSADEREIEVYSGERLVRKVKIVRESSSPVVQIPLSDWLEIVRAADRQFSRELAPSLQNSPIEYYIHLDSYKDLPERAQKDRIRTELAAIRARRANYVKVHLLSEDKSLVGWTMNQLPDSQKERFTPDARIFHPSAGQVHSLSIGYFERTKDKISSAYPNARFLTIDDVRATGGRYNYFTPSPLLSLVEKVAVIQNLSSGDARFEEAFSFFREWILAGDSAREETRKNEITKEDFMEFLKGNLPLIKKHRLTLPSTIAAIDLNLEIRIASMAARMAVQAA